MGLDVALLSADVSQDCCRAVAYNMQASRQAVQGSQELVVSIAAGTCRSQAAGSMPWDDLRGSVRGWLFYTSSSVECQTNHMALLDHMVRIHQ